jgi:multidrug efflux pump subunit AcrB
MQGISAFAVGRWQFTLVVFGMLLALGASSLAAIPKSEDPAFPLPVFVIVAVLPGAAPSDLEQLVVDPIEARIRTLDELDRVRSEIRDGLAVIEVEFEAGVDVSSKESDLRREIDALRPSLPPELARLELENANAAMVNVVEVGLVSDSAPFAELDRLARDLETRLEAVDGVGRAEIAGIPEQEVRVELDLLRMRALGISPVEVISALDAESRNVPAGTIEAGARRFTVRTRGDYQSVEAVRDTVIRSIGPRLVRLRDLAEVVQGDAEAIHLTRVDGRRAAIVVATQREGQNVLAVTRGIEDALDAFERTLPAGVELARTFVQARNVEHRLSGLARDFVIAIFLVLLTLLPLGVRASVVVMISIPLSIAVGLTLLYGAGHGINQLSIVGFVIALGLLVDDSVVVVENIERFLRLGYAPRDAAIAATGQITTSVVGCTATLILAFLPLLALPGTAGQFIRSLPLAVVLTVGASLAVSLTIVPFLASRILRPAGENGNAIFRAMIWMIETSYRPVLAWALRWPRAALAVAGALVASSIALVPAIGVSLFPAAGVPQFLVRIEAEEGASLAETDRAVRFVEQTLAARPEVAWQVANVGRGNPMIYYNVPILNERSNVGEVLAALDEFDPDGSPALFDRLRAELARYPGARIRVLELQNGPPLEAPIEIRLFGDDPAALADAAAEVEAVVASTPGTRDTSNLARARRIDLGITIDEHRAAGLGVVAPEIDRAVRLALGGIPAGRFHDPQGDRAHQIRVVVARDHAGVQEGAPRATLSTLDQVFVPTRSGTPVALSAIVSLGLTPSPSTIRHHDGERSSSVTAFVRSGENVDRVTGEIASRLAHVALPRGVRREIAGEAESRARSFGGIGTAILVAAFGILAVLVLEFRTFRGTLIVASVIPLGVIGGLVALLCTGNTLSFTAMIGFVALMGIEVKNSILLVDFTDQLRAQGVPLDAAIRRAGETRFVPVLLTTLTTFGGLVPLALERSPLYSPLAWVLLGGLISSTLLARVITPVMYKLLAPEVLVPETGEGDRGAEPEGEVTELVDLTDEAEAEAEAETETAAEAAE